MDLVAYYDAYWQKKGDLVDPARLAQIAVNLMPGERVLALDCGNGVMARKLADKGCHVVGTDMSAVAVAQTTAKGIPAYQVDLDVEPLPFGEGEFDTVLSDSGLEHRFSYEPALNEAVRVLKPGGKLVLTVPNLGHWLCRWWLLTGRFPYVRNSPTDFTHLRFFTWHEVKALLRARGLQIERLGGNASLWVWQFYPFPLRWPGISQIYAALAPRWPSLLARDLIVVARKP